MMKAVLKIVVMVLLALVAGGCATTYVPISWGLRDKVQELSRSDLTLATLFNRYDPDRLTLRVTGESFDETMLPSEVEHHLGAYRRDTKLIYRNYYKKYNERELRDLMVHELAHHIWFGGMNFAQREQWRQYLELNPSPVQAMVRKFYSHDSEFDSEDFAFTIEFARPIDLDELAKLKVITAQERDAMLKEQIRIQSAASAAPSPVASVKDAPSGTAKLADNHTK